MRAAASYVAEHAAEWPEGTVPTTVTQRAVLAVELHEVFRSENGETPASAPDPGTVLAEVLRLRGSR